MFLVVMGIGFGIKSLWGFGFLKRVEILEIEVRNMKNRMKRKEEALVCVLSKPV